MNNKFNYVLIDGSNLYHRSYSLFKPNGKNIINHLLETISKIQNDFCNNESLLYFIFDNSQSQINIRKQIDPLYKSNREKIDKEIYKYHNIFIELLKVKNDNYRILMAGTLEADDLVKPLIKYIDSLEKNYYRLLLISNDMDWSRNINDKVYDLLYSSRRVIKNDDLNTQANHYYSSDVWGDVARTFEYAVQKGYTLYGEIVGYTRDGSFIQKGYDYGCIQPVYENEYAVESTVTLEVVSIF
jgi:5'-3' exonuclease